MDEAHDLVQFAVTADTRSSMILLVSFLEDTLKKVFVNEWKIESKKEMDRFFGGSGPLATFSQRALVAAGVGWIEKEAVTEFDTLRKIRNTFAHDHRMIKIEGSDLVGLVTSLPPREQVWLYKEEYKDHFEKADEETKLKMRVFCSGLMLVAHLLLNSKMIATGIPKGFRSGSGFKNKFEIEQAMIDATIRYCWIATGQVYEGKVYEYRRSRDISPKVGD